MLVAELLHDTHIRLAACSTADGFGGHDRQGAALNEWAREGPTSARPLAWCRRNHGKTSSGRGSPAGGTRFSPGNRSGRRGAARPRTGTARGRRARGVPGRRGDPAPRSETERKAVCRKRLPGKVFYGYQPSKVLRQTECCGAHGPSAAAYAVVSAVLARCAPRGAGDGAPRAAPHNMPKRRALGPHGEGFAHVKAARRPPPRARTRAVSPNARSASWRRALLAVTSEGVCDVAAI